MVLIEIDFATGESCTWPVMVKVYPPFPAEVVKV